MINVNQWLRHTPYQMILILFTFLATTVLGQSVLQQQYELRTCISGSPDVLGLTGPFNEGLLPDSCVAVCKQESTDLAFITGGSNTKCYCGNTVPSQNNPPPLVICQSACADGISIGCGSNGLYDGLPAFAVYLVRFCLFKFRSMGEE